jgi:hypothetical protein
MGDVTTGALIGAGTSLLGMIGANTRRKQQMADQQKLMEVQQKNQMALNKQGQQLAQENWDYTNAENQVKHYENAGLNVGLMYRGNGAGGTLSSGSGGGASGGNAPQGESVSNIMGMGVQGVMAMQQIDNMKADAELKRAQANEINKKLPGGLESQGLTNQGIKWDNALKSGNMPLILELGKKEIENLEAKTRTEIANGTKTEIQAKYEEQQQKADLTLKAVETLLGNSKVNLTNEQKKLVIEQTKQVTQDVINSIENTRSNTKNADTNRKNADTNYQGMMDNYSTKVKDILIKQGFLDNEELKTTMNNIMSIIGLAK